MARQAKDEWAPCGICGDPDGPRMGKQHVTPSRYALGPEMASEASATEIEAWVASGKQPICGRCKNRLSQRLQRTRLRDEGKPTHPPPMREWEPPK